jgi:hypothetical protein
MLSASAARCAEPEQKLDLGRNAALIYWQAFYELKNDMTPEQDQMFDQWVKADRKGVASGLTDDQLDNLFNHFEPAASLMRKAVAIGPCDWGVNYEEGPLARLPHLGQARNLGRAAVFCAQRSWQKGDPKTAVENLRACVVLARQAGNDGRDTVIGGLVQIAIEGMAQKAAAALMADRTAADLLADALGDLAKGPPANLSENGMRSERNIFMPWLRRNLTESSAEARKRFVGDMTDLMGKGDESRSGVAQKLKLTNAQPDELRNWLEQLDKYYVESATAMRLPYHEFLVQAQKLASDMNPLESVVIPNLFQLRYQEEQYRIKWAMVRAGIAIRRDGENALSKVADPSDGKPFGYKALEGGVFQLTSALTLEGQGPITLTFGVVHSDK